ncbi:MAG: soluble lytic murein transglycosylase [Bradymonadia bacterium]|jgi:soluble lytic murein transglycosylase
MARAQACMRHPVPGPLACARDRVAGVSNESPPMPVLRLLPGRRLARVLSSLIVCLASACDAPPDAEPAMASAQPPLALVADARASDARASDARASDARLTDARLADATEAQVPELGSNIGEGSLPESTLAAQLHRRSGRLGMARAAFEAGWPAHESPEVALIVASLYQRAGEHRAALRWFARSDIPELADFIAFRVLRSAAALGDATLALHAAEQISPKSRFAPHARAQAAEALMRAGRPADAAHWLTEQPQKASNPAPEMLALQARAWQAAGHPERAIRAWRRVELRAGRGKARVQARKALRRLRWALPRARHDALQPDADAHLLAGRADLDAHAYSALEERMLAALRRGFDDPDIGCQTWWLLARARARMRRHGDAAPAYARAAEACIDSPMAPRARYAEARAWFSADDHAAALRAARQLWRRWPAHRLADDAWLLAARIHLARGEDAEARDRLTALLWHHAEAETTSDARWLIRGLGARAPAINTFTINAPVIDAADRAHRGRLAYFGGVDLQRAGHGDAAKDAFEAVLRDAPSGYYGVLAEARLRLAGRQTAPMAQVARVAITDADEGGPLLSLGFVQDAWWAFDDAGPGRLEPGRYRAGVARLMAAHGHAAMALRMFERDVPHLDGLPLNADTEPWFEAVYPIEHIEIFERWASERDLPVALVLALAHTESRFDPRARSWAGACGIMQMVPKTAAAVARREGIRGRITCRRLRDVNLSVRLATRYLADLRGQFGDHPGVLAAAYNAGPGNVAPWARAPRPPFDQWVEDIPFHQARRYVKRVLAAMAVYAMRRIGTLPDIAFDW